MDFEDTPARRRRELLDAAFAIIAEKGLEGLRTRDVAERAGVNISTLFYYFGSKHALLVAVTGHVREVFGAPMASGEAAYADLRSHLANAWARFQTNPDLAAVLQELMLLARRDDEVRLALADVLQHWHGVVTALVRRGVDNGELDPALDDGEAAAIVTSFMIGASLRLGFDKTAFSFEMIARALEDRLAARRRKGGVS
jgi:AcrR family transcriptional regulator